MCSQSCFSQMFLHCTNTEEKYGQYALDATLRIYVTNMLISLHITDLIPNEKVVDTNISL